MWEIIKSLVLGMVIWGVFTLFRLDIPAPPTLAGIAWIFGVYLGFILISNIDLWKYL